GSCCQKSLLGTPITIRPLFLNCCHNFCNPAYCPVNSHIDAVFTIKTGFPLKSAKANFFPSIASKQNSCAFNMQPLPGHINTSILFLSPDKPTNAIVAPTPFFLILDPP